MDNHLPVVVCDTCIFLHMIVGTDAQRAFLDKEFQNDAKSGLLRIFVSEVTIAEACKLEQDRQLSLESGPNSLPKKPIDVFNAIESFMALPYMKRRPVTAAVSGRASVLIRRYRLETCDALIVATALTHGATKFYTRDYRSICKKLRASQIPPATLDPSTPRNPFTVGVDLFPDESEVVAELGLMEIVPVDFPAPQPVAPQIALAPTIASVSPDAAKKSSA